MFYFLTFLIVAICALIILVVLIQNPKGGGLGSGFGASSANLMGGVKQTTDFLERTTWILVISLFVLCICSNMFLPSSTNLEQDQDPNARTKIEDLINEDGE